MAEVNTIKSIHPGWRVTPAHDKHNSKKKDQQTNAEDSSRSKNSDGHSDSYSEETGDGRPHIDDYV